MTTRKPWQTAFVLFTFLAGLASAQICSNPVVIRSEQQPQVCNGGSRDGLTCWGLSDCPGGTSCDSINAPAQCVGGSSDGAACSRSFDCPGGICGQPYNYDQLEQNFLNTRETCNAMASAGGIFQTMDTPAGSDPVADTFADTLALSSSGPLTITGDAGTDTIAFAVTPHSTAGDLTLAGDVDGLGNVTDLDELAVEAELEGVLDLADLQGTLDTAQLTDDPILEAELDTLAELNTQLGTSIEDGPHADLVTHANLPITSTTHGGGGSDPFQVGSSAPEDSLVIETTTGDVGIGTSSPVVNLHVLAATGQSAQVRIDSSNSANSQAVTRYVNDAGNWMAGIAFSSNDFFVGTSAANGVLEIETSAPANSLRILTSTGDVELVADLAVGGVADLTNGALLPADAVDALTEIADLCGGLEGIRRNAGDTAWECAASGGTDDQVASEVPFTPAGGIAATDVQAALEEVDAEHVPSLTTEEVEDLAGAMVTSGTETRIAVTYDDPSGQLSFVVDDMNDDVPENGDFGNAVDLEASGAVSPNAVALTTDTTGNYVASITNGAGITGGDGGSEGAALTLAATLGTAIDSAEITDGVILEADLSAIDAPADEECLTSEGTGFEWQACGGGGGSMPDLELNWPASTLLPLEHTSTAVPPIVADQGTNVDIQALAYDDTADECRSSTFQVPNDVESGSSITFRAVWYSPTATTGNLIWDIRHVPRSEGESWDAALTTETAAADATQGTVDQLTVTTWTETLANTGWAALDVVEFELCRDANNASDTLVGDAHLLSFSIEVPRA